MEGWCVADTVYRKQGQTFRGKDDQQRGDIHVSDEGPSFKTFDVVFHISAVHQLFIFRFVFQNCLRSTQCLLQNLNYLLFVHIL